MKVEFLKRSVFIKAFGNNWNLVMMHSEWYATLESIFKDCLYSVYIGG